MRAGSDALDKLSKSIGQLKQAIKAHKNGTAKEAKVVMGAHVESEPKEIDKSAALEVLVTALRASPNMVLGGSCVPLQNAFPDTSLGCSPMSYKITGVESFSLVKVSSLVTATLNCTSRNYINQWRFYCESVIIK